MNVMCGTNYFALSGLNTIAFKYVGLSPTARDVALSGLQINMKHKGIGLRYSSTYNTPRAPEGCYTARQGEDLSEESNLLSPERAK